MTEYYNKGHFKNLEKKLSDGFKLALRRTTSTGEIQRLTTLVRFKKQAIDKSASMYSRLKKMKGVKNKDLPLHIINDSLDGIMKASDLGTMRRISVLRDTKMKAWINIINET